MILGGYAASMASVTERVGIVSPRDLDCPKCGQFMWLFCRGEGMSKQYPKRVYFEGLCPAYHSHLYYHKDGWTPLEEMQGAQSVLEEFKAKSANQTDSFPKGANTEREAADGLFR